MNSSDRIDIEDDDNIADGTVYPLSISLQDQYGNNIIPTNTIGREIDIELDAQNTVYLDQFRRSGDSAIHISDTVSPTFSDFPIGVGNKVFTNQQSDTGMYTLSFRVYAPTYQYDTLHGSDPQAQFIINNISFDVRHDTEL